MAIFITIFGMGFLILIISLIFGHDTDVHVDVDASGADVGHGPGIFSVRLFALAMVGFGAVGFGVRATTEWTMFQSSMAGIAGALGIGAIGYFILRVFYASQESSTISDRDIIGGEAYLTDAISGGQNGQVACIIRGREITFLARSSDGNPIARNAPVRIVGKSGSIVTVEPIDKQQ